jgi:hypothetical protein
MIIKQRSHRNIKGIRKSRKVLEGIRKRKRSKPVTKKKIPQD